MRRRTLRTGALAVALAAAVLAADARPRPVPAVPVGGGVFKCRLIPLYFLVHPQRGFIPQWIVLAYMNQRRVCA